MTEQIKKINNPLTIIAIFAALAEVSATVAIGLIDKSLHHIFIWFIIGFPTLLVVLFFLTLNYNTKVMYSPSDYREDKNFIDSLYGQAKKESKTSSSINPELLNSKLEKLEEKFIKSIDDKTASKSAEKLTKKDVIEIVEKYKDEMKSFTESAKTSTKKLDFEIPDLLKSAIVQWISFPAFIPIIYAIVKENCNSSNDLEAVVDKYNLPARWDTAGIKNLLVSGVLTGKQKKFSIEKSIEEPLNKWIDINENTIISIVDIFGSNDEKNLDRPSVRARQLTQHLII